MKKIILPIILFFMLGFFAQSTQAALGVIQWLDQNGNPISGDTISFSNGQTVSLFWSVFSMNPPTTYSIKLLNSQQQVVKTYVSGINNGVGGVTNINGTQIVQKIDYNAPGTYQIEIYAGDQYSSDWDYLTFTATNQNPVARNDAFTVQEDSSNNLFNVLLNDSDPNGDVLSINSFTQPAHGTLTKTNSNLYYTPNTNYYGADSFTYTASDGYGGLSTATVLITVTPVNDAPVAYPVSVFTFEDVSKQVVFNCFDVDGDYLTYFVVSNPVHGTLSSVVGDKVVYSPAQNFNSVDSFTYKCNDGSLDSGVAAVSITVTPVNDVPVWTSNIPNANLDEDFGTVVHVGNLLSLVSDVDGDSLSFSVVSENTAQVDCEVVGSVLKLVSVLNWNGVASCSVRVSDGNGGTADNTFAITVNPVDDAPVAYPVSVFTYEDVSKQVVFNCSDVDSGSLTYFVVSKNPYHGSLGFVVDNHVTYTPSQNYVGSDNFTYKCNDGFSNSNIASVLITVTAVDDAPVVSGIPDQTINEGQSFSTFDLDSYLTEVDGDSVVWSYSGNSALTVSINAQNVVTITTPSAYWNGAETITFTATDVTPNHLSGSDSAVFSVVSQNNPPVWTSGIPNAILNEDFGTYTHVVDLRTLVFDADGDSLSFSVINENTAEVDCEVVGNSLKLHSVLNWNGVASCSVRVSDGNGGTADNTFTINVIPVNDPPIGNAGGPYSGVEGFPINLSGAGSYDPDGDILEYKWILQHPPFFETNWSTSSNLTYTFRYNGWWTFRLAVRDSHGVIDRQSTAEVVVSDYRPIPQIIANPASGPAPLTVSFRGNVTKGNPPFRYQWDFLSDGTIDSYSQNTTYTFNQSGTYATTLRVIDDDNDMELTLKTIVVTPAVVVNHAPVAYNQAVSLNEDNSKLITLVATDADNDLLTYSIVTQPTHGVLLTLLGNNVTYTPNQNYNGADSFTFKAFDGLNYSNVATVSITVNPVDDAPVAYPLLAVTNEDVSKQVTFNCSDVDGDNLTYSIVSSPSHGSLGSVVGNTVIYTSALNYFGADSFTYKCSDQFSSSNNALVSITINPVDDAPVVLDIPNQTINEGQSFSSFDLDTYLIEVDGDAIVWTYSGNTDLTVNVNSQNVVTITPPSNNWNGAETITFTATDVTPAGLFDSDSAVFSVVSQNDNPVWTSNIPSVTLDEDFPVFTHVVDLSALVFDADGDVLSFSVVNENTAQVNCEVVGSVLKLYSVLNWNGVASCSVRVSDGNGGTADNTFAITVNPVNDAPVVSDIPDQTVNEGQTFTTINLDNYVSDVDNLDSEMTWTYVGNTDLIVSISPSRVATISVPNANWFGFETITFTASDPGSLSDSDSAVFSVVSQNDNPVWTSSIPSVTLDEDFGVFTHVVDLSALVFDADGDVLSFSVVNENTAQVNCEVVGNTLKLHSVLNWNGVASCSVRVSDGNGGTADNTFAITVNPVNDAPIMQLIPDMNATENSTFTYQVVCSDVDGDPITYSDNTNLFNINPTSGLISFTPTVSDGGAHTITISCSDGVVSVSDPFTLTVYLISMPPTILGADLVAYIGREFVYQVQASDSNNDPLTFSDDTGLFNINSTSGVIRFTPTQDQFGQHWFYVSVFDGTFSASALFRIRVIEFVNYQCSDGVDNDGDGLTDYPDDPGCESPTDIREFSIVSGLEDSDAVKIVDVTIYGYDYNTVRKGEYALVAITLENTFDKKVSDIAVGVMIPEYGLKEQLSVVDIHAKKRTRVKSYVYIPNNIKSGDYYFSVYTGNDDLRREKQIPVRII
ncbi:MAG: tandem-95 repeat protein [Nanoarchaeota archaeon]|nr:tandem-95 repeat protein [Nanoarchaeota archaeon]MBU2443800.1 tandem-95 repeat protein [Nanoarchaeota archaeon]